MGKITKGALLVSSAYMFACSIHAMFVTKSLFWELLFMASSALNMGMFFNEE